MIFERFLIQQDCERDTRLYELQNCSGEMVAMMIRIFLIVSYEVTFAIVDRCRLKNEHYRIIKLSVQKSISAAEHQ